MRIVRSASELTPESWQHLLTLVAEQRLEEAHERITQYLRSFPDHPQLWIQRGNLFWKQHQMEEAELAYRQAAKLAPESAAACWCLVLLYQHMERTDEAARWYQRAMLNGLPATSSSSLSRESGRGNLEAPRAERASVAGHRRPAAATNESGQHVRSGRTAN